MKTNKRALRVFTALADETRLAIIMCLAERPKIVCELHKCVGQNQQNKITLSAVSHQLRYLANLDLVSYKRSGKEKKYSLSDDFCWCILKNADEHFNKKRKCRACTTKN